MPTRRELLIKGTVICVGALVDVACGKSPTRVISSPEALPSPSPAKPSATAKETPKIVGPVSLDLSEFIPQVDTLSKHIGIKIRVKFDTGVTLQWVGNVQRTINDEGFLQVLGKRDTDKKSFWMAIRRDVPDTDPKTPLEEELRGGPHEFPKNTILDLLAVEYQMPHQDLYTYEIKQIIPPYVK